MAKSKEESPHNDAYKVTQWDCPICKKPMKVYEDEQVKQYGCEKCGVWYNV